MKTLVILISLTLSTFAISQETFHANISGRLRLPTFSPRIQLEVALENKWTIGANAPDYFLDGDAGLISTYSGNKFELFGRRYSDNKGRGSAKGWFGQAKAGYGNYNNPRYDAGENYTNRRWNSFGGGIGGGYKLLIGNHFNMEFYGGMRYYQGPKFKRSASFDALDGYNEDFHKISWYTWTAFPLEFNFRIGYQF